MVPPPLLAGLTRARTWTPDIYKRGVVDGVRGQIMLRLRARLVPVETDGSIRYRVAELKDGEETDLLAVILNDHTFATADELRNFLIVRMQREVDLSASEHEVIEGGTTV
jgi:enhancing lycopene biosynthesis protein 2